jgi:3-phosphoshikimate 1-carboxyvinyltransferase
MGGAVEELPDGMRITGGQPLHGTEVFSHGDHRIAMAFAIAGLSAEGTTDVRDTACIDTSYPGFESTLRGFLA